jgi:fructose-1,6-bisphosphatase I
MEERNKTLGEFIIEKQSEFQYSSGELSRIINSIRLAAKVVNYKVNKAGLVDIVGAAGEQNIQGEDQQKLDVYANTIFIPFRVLTKATTTNMLCLWIRSMAHPTLM